MVDLKNRKAFRAFIAGAAGIALLAGGTTFALWTEAATVNGGSVTAGSFDFATSGTAQWTDTKNAKVITKDVNNKLVFLAVPGDVIKLVQPSTIKATGDNLKAQLTAISAAAQANMAANGITVNYSMYKGTDTTLVANRIVAPTALGASAPAVAIPASVAAGDTYTIVLDVAFSASAPIDLQGVNTNLGDITFTMDQVTV